MRIVSWNCQGAFRNKQEKLLNLKSDLAIIIECEAIEKIKFEKKPNDQYWYGNQKKGIGIFSFSDYKIKPIEIFNPFYRYVIPLIIYNKDNSFLLFAVWAMDSKENLNQRYIGQVWLAINFYEKILNLNSVIIGDFNSNKIWDEKEKIGNHTDVVNLLVENNIISLYHEQEKINHGEETEHTFFMYRNIEKKYHIDYAFVSKKLIKNGYLFKIDNYLNWKNISDHCPLIIDFLNFESTEAIDIDTVEFISSKLKGLNLEIKKKFKSEIDSITKIIHSELNNKIVTEIYSKIDTLEQIENLLMKLNKKT